MNPPPHRSRFDSMRKLLNTLFPGLLSSRSQNVTVTRDGLTYHQDTNKPVTGIVEEFHENGQLMGRGNFIDGKREGLKEVFYRNGQLQYRGNHIDGEIDGLSESFHGNGQLRWRTNYKDGKLEGPLEYFDRNGNLTKTETYRNGELVERNRNP